MPIRQTKLIQEGLFFFVSYKGLSFSANPMKREKGLHTKTTGEQWSSAESTHRTTDNDAYALSRKKKRGKTKNKGAPLKSFKSDEPDPFNLPGKSP